MERLLDKYTIWIESTKSTLYYTALGDTSCPDSSSHFNMMAEVIQEGAMKTESLAMNTKCGIGTLECVGIFLRSTLSPVCIVCKVSYWKAYQLQYWTPLQTIGLKVWSVSHTNVNLTRFNDIHSWTESRFTLLSPGVAYPTFPNKHTTIVYTSYISIPVNRPTWLCNQS